MLLEILTAPETVGAVLAGLVATWLGATAYVRGLRRTGGHDPRPVPAAGAGGGAGMMVDPALCPCGTWRSIPHRCEYQQGRGHCRRCLAEYGDPACCTPSRLARIVRVRAKPCGCLPGDICGCGPWTSPPVEAPTGAPLMVGTASYGTGRGWTR